MVVFGQLGRLERSPVPVVIGLALWNSARINRRPVQQRRLGVCSTAGLAVRYKRLWAAGKAGAPPDWLQSEANTLPSVRTYEAARLPWPVARRPSAFAALPLPSPSLPRALSLLAPPPSMLAC